MHDSIFDETNFESTVRDYEFTRRAKHQIQQIVNSEDFQDMDSEAIFRYLYGSMQIVSFKDYLKRYIYERLNINEPFSSVRDEDYRDIITYSFEENTAPHSFEPSSTRFSMTVKGWLTHDSVRRNSIFLLGFGLRMTDEDVSMFLTKVIKDEDFNFSDPREAAFWYCFHTQNSYAEVSALMKDAKNTDSCKRSTIPIAVKNTTDALNARLNERTFMVHYLSLLMQSNTMQTQKKISYMHFVRLVEEAKKEVATMYNEDWFESDKGKHHIVSDISSADLEKVICSGIPVTKNGNLQKASASLLNRQFSSFRLSRQRIDYVTKQLQEVDRYDLITLEFFLFARKDLEDIKERFQSFVQETNQVLEDCGLMKLHPVNPYEAFVMMCMLSELPLATYSEVWEKAYYSEE